MAFGLVRVAVPRVVKITRKRRTVYHKDCTHSKNVFKHIASHRVVQKRLIFPMRSGAQHYE